MKSYLFTLAGIAAIVISTNSHGQGLKDAAIAFQSANWKVLRSIDSMKDTTSCTGIYKDNYAIQLTTDTLFLGVQGGIQSVTLRYGDKAARSLRLADEMEKKIRSVIIKGADFAELSGSDRLRYQVSTLVSGIKTDELDLVGFEETLANIRSGCPTPTNASVAPKATSPTGSICTATHVERMRAQGVKDEQIQAICR
jgi:hypothetical protein